MQIKRTEAKFQQLFLQRCFCSGIILRFGSGIILRFRGGIVLREGDGGGLAETEHGQENDPASQREKPGIFDSWHAPDFGIECRLGY
jgi:hypothetical protein